MSQLKKLFETDLLMLHTALFHYLPAAVVYDPQEIVVRNADSDFVFITKQEELAIVEKSAERILLFDASTDKEAQHEAYGAVVGLQKLRTTAKAKKLFVLLGNYNTIRFAISQQLKSPLFYRVRHENFEFPGYKQFADRLYYSMGLQQILTEGQLYYSSKEEIASPFFIFSENFVFEKIGDLFLVKGKEITGHKRFCASELGRARLGNEWKVLKALEQHQERKILQVPKALSDEEMLTLSPNIPSGATTSDQLSDIHFDALDELYDLDRSVMKTDQFLHDNSYLNTIKAVRLILEEDLHPNGLSRQNVEDLCIELLSLINRLNKVEPFYVSLYHGEFVEHNILEKNRQLHVNHWEKADADKPLLFDIFYFLFSKVEKTEIPKMGELDDMMKHLFKSKSMMALIEKYDINFKHNLALFHVHHILGQLEKFLKQRFIRPEANFTLKFWEQALQRMMQVEI